MNERIKELALLSFNETRHLDLDLLRFSEKFAELIVRECAEVGLDSVENGDNLDAIMRRVHNNILDHFGVKA